MICTPVLVRHVEEIVPALRRAARVADLVEIRLDYVEDFDFSHPTTLLERILRERPRPVLVTFRPTEQGGKRPLSMNDRTVFWRQALGCNADWFDIEADFASTALSDFSDVPWDKIVVSHHDFETTPPDLPAFVESRFPAQTRIVKLAVTTRDADDLDRLFQLLEHLNAQSRKAILIGMGSAGLPSRVLGPARGCLWTYSTASDGRPSAPGQFTAAELKDLYRIHRLSPETTLTGIVGKPVGHSLSPHMHNAAFRHLGLDWTYVPFEIQTDGRDLAAFLERFVHPRTRLPFWRTRGLSVTIPHKINVMPFLDSLTPTASAVGAVNTIIVEPDKLVGDNTDVEGAMRPLEGPASLDGARVAVLGAGGAAHAVVFGLTQRGADVTIFARDSRKGEHLKEKFGVRALSFERFSGRDFDGLVNTTPVGMTGHSVDETPVDAETLAGLAWVYDLIYRPRETRLLREAKARGIATLDGLDMLIEQAGKQFEAWTQKAAPLDVMRDAARRCLEQP